jgi:hypothetical protein
MTRYLRSALIGLAVAGLAGTLPVAAETMTYSATLKSASEVPPNSGGGSGTLTATYDTTTKTLTWEGNYQGLSGPPIAAHFHGPAAPGTNAPVLVPAPVKSSPFKGAATLTPAEAQDLADGKVYFNIHTAAHKGGEIRGQVLPASKG